jgi:hypothetical protein
MGDVDDPYFAPFAGILAENVQKTASIRSPNRLGRPSLIVCQASRLTRRPEVRVKRQHINLTPEATRKPTEGKNPAIWRNGGHVIAPNAWRRDSEPVSFAGEGKEIYAFSHIFGFPMGSSNPTPIRRPRNRSWLSRGEPRFFLRLRDYVLRASGRWDHH